MVRKWHFFATCISESTDTEAERTGTCQLN